MQVIHFTEGATDPVRGLDAKGTRVVPLATGPRPTDAKVSCYHIAPGGRLGSTPFVHDCALLVVSGQVTLTGGHVGVRLDMPAGVGVVLSAGEPFVAQSASGGVLLTMETPGLSSTERGRSTPARIAGQRWPGERGRRRSWGQVVRSVMGWLRS